MHFLVRLNFGFLLLLALGLFGSLSALLAFVFLFGIAESLENELLVVVDFDGLADLESVGILESLEENQLDPELFQTHQNHLQTDEFVAVVFGGQIVKDTSGTSLRMSDSLHQEFAKDLFG